MSLTAVTTGNSANVAADLGNIANTAPVYLYLHGTNTLLGTASFTGASTVATSTITATLGCTSGTTGLCLTKDADVLIDVRADLTDIGTGLPGTNGDLIKIDPINAEGSGASSGATLVVAGGTGSAGVRVFNTFPVIALDQTASGIPVSTGVSDGRLMRFKITADLHGDVSISKFTFTYATTTLSISNIGLFGYTDSGYTTPMSGNFAVGGTSNGGQVDESLATTSCRTSVVNTTTAGSTCVYDATNILSTLVIKPAVNPVTIPAGTTRYFELKASVAGNISGAQVVTKMLADSAMATGTPATLTAKNFIWSPNATTTATFTDVDWAAGANIVGFPTSGLLQSRSF